VRKSYFVLVTLLFIQFQGALVFSQTSPADNPELVQALKPLEAQLDSLGSVIGGYPPHFDSPAQKEQVESKLKATMQTLNAIAGKYPNNAKVELRLGEGYNMAHNLDWPGAAEDAVKYLKMAIEHAPDLPYPHEVLGRLYVNSNMTLAPAAEKEFQKVLELAHGDKALEAAAYQGLFFANYYQGKMKEAVAQADLYLQIHPEDAAIKKLRGIALEKSPKTN